MPAILSTILLPAVTKGPSAFFRLFSAACEETAGFLGRRTAIACLYGLDERALQDIGLVRFQIEAAVYGLVPLSNQADRGTTSFGTATGPRGQGAQMVEAASWS